MWTAATTREIVFGKTLPMQILRFFWRCDCCGVTLFIRMYQKLSVLWKARFRTATPDHKLSNFSLSCSDLLPKGNHQHKNGPPCDRSLLLLPAFLRLCLQCNEENHPKHKEYQVLVMWTRFLTIIFVIASVLAVAGIVIISILSANSIVNCRMDQLVGSFVVLIL